MLNAQRVSINTCIRKIHFLAQALTETGVFEISKEHGREKMPYDPWRGRGVLQLTLKEYYNQYAKYLVSNRTIQTESQVMNDLDIVCNRLDMAIDSGGWEWSLDIKTNFSTKEFQEKFKEIFRKSLNQIADHGWTYRYRISRLLNGGNNGFIERMKYYLTLEEYFEYETICINKSKELKSAFQEDEITFSGKKYNVASKTEMYENLKLQIGAYLNNAKSIK